MKSFGSLVGKSEIRLKIVKLQRKVPCRREVKIASSYRGFELSGFQGIGVKITINIRGKSKGDQF